MKKILFLILFLSSLFAQIKIQQLPDADTTLSQILQKNSLIILNQDPTGLGGSNYVTRKIALENFLYALSVADTNIVLQNKVNRFFRDNYFYNNWFFASDSSSIGTTEFLSGLGGAGLRIYKGNSYASIDPEKPRFGGGWIGEYDNLLVRGNAYFAGLQSSQTNTSNGNFHITNSAVVDSVYYLESTDISYNSGSPIILENGDTLQAYPYEAVVSFQDPQNTNIAPYVVGDLIEHSLYSPVKNTINYSGYLIRLIRGEVVKVVGKKVYLQLDISCVDKTTDLRGLVLPGQTYARVGNKVDPTKQGSFYFDVNGFNSPQMIIYDGVDDFTTWDSFSKVKGVIGKMTGIVDPVFGNLGEKTTYGAYFPSGTFFARNVEIDGNIKITAGETLDTINAVSQKSDEALTNSLGAVAIANTKIKVYRQSTSPGIEGNTVGDLWLKTDEGNKMFRWDGSVWSDVQDLAADWDQLGNIPSTLEAPSGTGLFLDATHMGYYESGDWKTYIENNGNFYFTGDSNNFISWNGSQLLVRGELNADDIVGGTITGIKIISTTGSNKIVLDGSTLTFGDGEPGVTGLTKGTFSNIPATIGLRATGNFEANGSLGGSTIYENSTSLVNKYAQKSNFSVGSENITSLYVASTLGGSATTQLKTRSIKIDGTTFTVLVP